MPGRPISSVLFACTSNSIRSRMAAALAAWRTRGKVYIDSCGVRPGELDGFVQAALDEIGLDDLEDPPKSFDELDADAFDLIITLSPEAHAAAQKIARRHAVEVDYWPTVDPSLVEGSREQRLEAYRKTRDEILQRISARLSGPSAPVV